MSPWYSCCCIFLVIFFTKKIHHKTFWSVLLLASVSCFLFIVCFLLVLCAMFVLGVSARVHKVTAASQALTQCNSKGLRKTKAHPTSFSEQRQTRHAQAGRKKKP